MLVYSFKRLLESIPTLLLLLTLTFFLLRLAPGGPFDSERAFPTEVLANIHAHYGLDRPLPQQFLHWLRDLLRGDLHESFQYLGRPVTEIIGYTLPVSIQLGVYSLLFSLGVGIPLGAISAARRGSWIDASAMFVAISGVSLPSYLVASILILTFSLGLGWLPPALLEDRSSWILPVITLGLRPMAMIARITRTSMIESLQSDYIRTATGKGLSELHIVFKHALANSLVPVVTLLGPITANLVTGSFLVEVVFQLPGMGKYFVSAVINRDYPLVMGVTLVYGLVLMSCNLLVDLLYGVVDPRIRVQQ